MTQRHTLFHKYYTKSYAVSQIHVSYAQFLNTLSPNHIELASVYSDLSFEKDLPSLFDLPSIISLLVLGRFASFLKSLPHLLSKLFMP
jgi:hypothetical protein